MVGKEAIFKASLMYRETKTMMMASVILMVSRMSSNQVGIGMMIIETTMMTNTAKTKSLYFVMISLTFVNERARRICRVVWVIVAKVANSVPILTYPLFLRDGKSSVRCLPPMTTQEIEALRKKYYNATLRELKEIQPGLWIFRIQPDAGIPKFKPGQYTTLGMGMWEGCVEGNAPETLRPGDEKKLLRRAYSMSHPVLNPKTGKLYTPREIDFVEFYITLVLVGGTTPTPPRLTPRLFTLKPGAH